MTQTSAHRVPDTQGQRQYKLILSFIRSEKWKMKYDRPLPIFCSPCKIKYGCMYSILDIYNDNGK